MCHDNAEALEQIYGRFIGKELTFAEVVVEKKRLVMNSLLGVEMRTLGHQLAELAADDRYARELPQHELTSALIETTAYLPVYRTYIRNLAMPDESKAPRRRSHCGRTRVEAPPKSGVLRFPPGRSSALRLLLTCSPINARPGSRS